MTNRPDYERGCDGLEVVVRKRMRDHWMLDAFNVGNANTVLARRPIQNSATLNYVSATIAPRVIRLGLRANR